MGLLTTDDMSDNVLHLILQRALWVERYYRLIRRYIFHKHGVKRIWSYVGDVNEYRLIKPRDLLRGYFLDFSRDADYMGPFDAQDIPIVDYGGLIGRRYNPWAVGHYALASFQKYLQTRNENYYAQFLRCAHWLIDRAEYRQDGSAVWTYDFSLVEIHSKPWISALAQAHAISVLLRAFLSTENGKFLETAEKAFVPFTLPVGGGGVQTMDGEGGIFFEEDASLHVPYILNGFIFALFGIYDFASLKNGRAWELWDKGLDTLRRYLPSYDIGFFSLYNLSSPHQKRLRNVASLFYHLVHIRQLQVLYTLTKETLFHEYANRWTVYLEDYRCRLRAYLHKVIFKLLKY